ncbi:MAG: hypothetical protein MUE70_02705 [Desulfobacterales bacterium]|jgi:hypothetical protein|nr:hypothetical protein [Desulfobacterales bacterium]
MEQFQFEDLIITPRKKGAVKYAKISYPLRFGVFSEIRNSAYTYQFNLNGEIKTIQGRGEGWLDAAEWLKRTVGDDWVYFSAGGYTGAYDYTGEYYVPCLAYESNTVYGNGRFESSEVLNAFAAWEQLQKRLQSLDLTSLQPDAANCIRQIIDKSPAALKDRAERFHRIIGGRVTVLPPDTRHVEYDVIPVNISDGCLYHCGFCRVKSTAGYKVRSETNILSQIEQLNEFFGKDIINCNSVFLGQHDALFAGADIIEWTARKAYEVLRLGSAYMKEPRLFLFGSVDSLLNADNSLFSALNRLPYQTYINIGLETADAQTLSILKKPLNPDKISEAFHQLMAVNHQYANIEITANFVYGADLPETHLPSILGLTRHQLNRSYSKGTIYISPLENSGTKQELLSKFIEFKKLCRLPVYIYLIQRL